MSIVVGPGFRVTTLTVTETTVTELGFGRETSTEESHMTSAQEGHKTL